MSAGARPLGDESEPVVRLLACAYRVISKRLGDSRSSGIGVVVSRSRGGDCFPLSRPRSTIEIVGRSSARAAGWTLSRRGRIVGVRCCPSASSELTFAPRASRR